MPDRSPLEQAATADALGKATPVQGNLLTTDLDAWASTLRRIVASIDEQRDSRQACVDHAREIGDHAAAELHATRLHDWWPKASRLRDASADRIAHVDRLRAVQAHQQVRVVVDLLLKHEVIDDPKVNDHLARLLDRLEVVDPIDLPRTA